MDGLGLHEDLGRGGPHHDQPVAPVRLPERTDILAELFGELALVRAGLDVGAVQLLHVVRVERGRHRLDRPQEVTDRLDVLGAQHAAHLRRLVAVVGYGIPRPEHEVVEIGERHEVLDEGRPVVGPLAEPNGVHLGQRAEGLVEPPTRGLHTGDECRRDGAESDEKHAELAFGGRDVLNRPVCPVCGHVSILSVVCSSADSASAAASAAARAAVVARGPGSPSGRVSR